MRTITLLAVLVTVSLNELFTNIQVDRNIKLGGNLTKTENILLVQSNSVEPINSYDYLIPLEISSKLVSLQARMVDGETEIPLEFYRRDSEFFSVFSISFGSNPMNREEIRKIVVEEVFYQINQVLPKSIGLKQEQFLVVELPGNCISAYKSKGQSTSVLLPNTSSILK